MKMMMLIVAASVVQTHTIVHEGLSGRLGGGRQGPSVSVGTQQRQGLWPWCSCSRRWCWSTTGTSSTTLSAWDLPWRLRQRSSVESVAAVRAVSEMAHTHGAIAGRMLVNHLCRSCWRVLTSSRDREAKKGPLPPRTIDPPNCSRKQLSRNPSAFSAPVGLEFCKKTKVGGKGGVRFEAGLCVPTGEDAIIRDLDFV